jgi:pentatricopeptide repeat protein
VVPWQITCKYFVHMLIREGCVKESIEVLGLMKSDGFPPFIDPFFVQISKSGTLDDALGLLQAASLKGIVPVKSSLRLF